jgi:hypothetical protein
MMCIFSYWTILQRRVNRVVSSDLMKGLAAPDGLHGYTGLEFGTVGSALGQLLRRRLRLPWQTRVEAVHRP